MTPEDEAFDANFDRVTRAMWDHREHPDFASACMCGKATYSTPGYWWHVYEVARALERHPEAVRITERHLRTDRALDAETPPTPASRPHDESPPHGGQPVDKVSP